MTCLCLAGIQTRYEHGCGVVEMPCPICERKRWEEYWREREKREKIERAKARSDES